MILADSWVLEEVFRQDVGLWFCYSPYYGDEIIILKTQMDSAKAIYQGCDVEIGFGKKEIGNYFAVCSFVNIYDLNDSGALLVQAVKNHIVYDSIQKIIEKKNVLIVVLDELPRILFSASLTFLTPYSFSETRIRYDYNYDQFDSFLEEAQSQIKNDEAESFCKSKVKLSDLRVKNSDFINMTRGEYFERSIYESLVASFRDLLFWSPRVTSGKKIKEFTDVFAVHEDFCLLIEAKSLVADHFYVEKSQSKYIAALIGHVKKAIRQLTGAAKAFRRNEQIYDGYEESKLVNCDRRCTLYALILIPEFVYHDDWSVIAQKILEAYNKVECYMCLMDLSELMEIQKISNGDPTEIARILRSHFDVFIKHNSVHVRLPRFGQDRPYV